MNLELFFEYQEFKKNIIYVCELIYIGMGKDYLKTGYKFLDF